MCFLIGCVIIRGGWCCDSFVWIDEDVKFSLMEFKKLLLLVNWLYEGYWLF